MGQRSSSLIILAILACWAVGAESIDMAKARLYKLSSSSSLTGKDFLDYLKVMDIPLKNGQWAFGGDLVTSVEFYVGKNKDSKWQIHLIVYIGDDASAPPKIIIFNSGDTITSPLIDGRNATQTFTVGTDNIKRVIKLINGLESTQVATFQKNGEMVTVTLKAKTTEATLKFKKDPVELTPKDLTILYEDGTEVQ